MYFLCALVYPDANVICAMIWHHVLPNEVASVLRLVFKWLYLNPDKPDPFGSLLPIRRHCTIIPLATQHVAQARATAEHVLMSSISVVYDSLMGLSALIRLKTIHKPSSHLNS